ncbi:MAG TPA: DUF2141 domain-containing protein [Caulobacteraceae bacterium]|jgi:uncharacterized protein (DUF2141 family)
MKLFALIAAAGLLAAGSASAQSAGGRLTVEVSVAAPGGQLMVALYDAQTYDGGRPLQAVRVEATDRAVAAFAGLAPGRYAIKAFHDVDGDSVMAVNPFGVPLEPYAFSNNARGRMGAPAFEAAAFEVGADGAAHSLDIG